MLQGAYILAQLCEGIAELIDLYIDLREIADAKARQKSIVLRGKTAHSRLGVRRHLSTVGVENAMERFEHYERKMDDLEGQVEAYDLGRRTLADQIQELETGDEIDAELARLKDHVSGDQNGSGT